MTEGARCSLTLCLLQLNACDEDGTPFVANATVFVSHAWRYKAKDAFPAMESYATNQPTDAPTDYFWFDIFTNDQHDTLSLPQLWWRDAFMEGVRLIGHTLLILAPWDDPRPLKRAWCLWEILSTSRTNSRLSIEMAPSQIADFEEHLKDKFEKVTAAVSNIDMRQSEAFLKTDEAMIKEAVKATVGFTELNSMIAERMRDWLAVQGREALKRLDHADRAASPLALNLARLLQDQAKLEEAEQLGREACEAIEKNKGEGSIEGYHAMNVLARVLKDRGEYGEAESLFRQAVEGYNQTEGIDSLVALTANNNLAELLLHVGRPQEAEPLLETVLAKCKETLPEKDPLTLITANNLATILLDRKAFDEAEPLLKFTYDTRVEVYGKRHPSTLNALNWLASVYKGLKKLEEAEQAYEEVVNARKETLGELHMSTLTSINNFAVFLGESQKFDKALGMLKLSYDGFKVVLGVGHDKTVAILLNYTRLLYNIEGPETAMAVTRKALDECVSLSGERAASGETTERQAGLEAGLLLAAIPNIATQLATFLSHDGKDDEAEAVRKQYLPAG